MLHLPTVTQVIIDCADVARAERVIRYHKSVCVFADTMLFSSLPSSSASLVPIPEINSVVQYSEFCLKQLGLYINTKHILVCQHDGYIRDVSMWDPAFLEYDYIGAPWLPDKGFCNYQGGPWHPGDGPNVGNGGFSLRSSALMCFLATSPLVISTGLEDVDIAVHNRFLLENHGFTFAPEELASRFSWETGEDRASFGVHGRGTYQSTDYAGLHLPDVTQVIIDCEDITRAEKVLAYQASMIDFGGSVLFSSLESRSAHSVKIPHMRSAAEYSHFYFGELYKYIHTSHVLVFQHDAFVLQPNMWSDEFLKFDYVGCIQHRSDTEENPSYQGGFSLRSCRLQMFLAATPNIIKTGSDDYDICVRNRPILEAMGFMFAPPEITGVFGRIPGVYASTFGGCRIFALAS